MGHRSGEIEQAASDKGAMAMQQEKRDRLQGTGGNCRPPQATTRYRQEKQEKRDRLKGTGRKLATSTDTRYKQEKEGKARRRQEKAGEER